jgi:multidrug efflux pump subunit AcrB
MTIEIDRDAAAKYGITPEMLNDTLYYAFGQRQATQYFTQTNYYHVVLEVLPQVQASPTALHEIFIRSPLTHARCPCRPSRARCRPGRLSSITRACSRR